MMRPPPSICSLTGQDSKRLWARPAVTHAGSDDHVGEDARTAPLEAGVRVPCQDRVENTFFRDKSIIGDGLRARSPAGQGSEVVLGCEILNRMTEFGRPVVISYRQVRILSVGIVRASDDSCNHARKEGDGRAQPSSTREPTAGCSGRQPSTLVRKIGNPSLSAYLGR